MTTARHRAIDRLRRARVMAAKLHPLAPEHAQHAQQPEQAREDDVAEPAIPDERLELVFMCRHPALAIEAQVALTLRAAGGLTTEEIARFAPVVPTRLTAAKATTERAWLGEVSAVVLQQALADLNAGYRNFFASAVGRRNGPKVAPPRFRSRKDSRQAIRFTANARFQVTSGGKLRLPKIGDVPVRWSRPLPSEPSSVAVIKDSSGRYFASFVIQTGPDALPETEPVIGVDLGLTHFAVLSDGRKIASPRFLRRTETKLKRAQKALSHKQKGSRNRDKARVKVARAHARVADARREFHHQLSTALIRENQAVAVEDLAVKALARTRIAKSVHDAGWSAFVHMLEYKARRYGREFRRIGRFEPTSQVCSACGAKDGPKPLNVRIWQCRECGVWLDRDINAAVNVARAAGLAVLACGAQVRPGVIPAQRGEAGTLPGAA